MVIIKTKIVLYMKRSCGYELHINDVLKFTYNEILNDEYDSETTLQAERFGDGENGEPFQLNFNQYVLKF